MAFQTVKAPKRDQFMGENIRVAAECHGVKVPQSPLITPHRVERINSGSYEGLEIAGAVEVIDPNDHVLELGAGLGLVGAIAAKACNAKKVISFEANPALIENINQLYNINGLQDRIEVRNEVLMSDPSAPETISFYVQNSYLGSSLIENKGRQTTSVTVPTTQYATIHKDFKPSVILMDIEGGELEFLRHASLEGVRAMVLEFHPQAYGRAGMQECKTILLRAGFVKLEEHSNRSVWTCVREPEETPPSVEGGWSTTIRKFPNAVVVPPVEAAQSLVQTAGVLDGNGRYVSTAALWRNDKALTIEPSFPEELTETLNGKWMWAGVLWMHFGHFIVESSSRLWAIEHLKESIDGIIFMPKRPRNLDKIRDFQNEFIHLLAPDMPIKCIYQPTRVEELIVPGQGFGLGPISTGTKEFRQAFDRNFATSIEPFGPEKLYISRSGLPAGRGNLIGELELETHLKQAGYTIYHPEKHDLTHQIAAYKAARHIIAAEGSALHLLAMVAKHSPKVAIILRRLSGATKNIENHLHSFAGIEATSLQCLTRSWKPFKNAKSRLWMGELDMVSLHSELVQSGFIRRNTAKWPALDQDMVKERLDDSFELVT